MSSLSKANWDEKACGGPTQRGGYDNDYFCNAWFKVSEYERVLTIERTKLLRLYRADASDGTASSAIIQVNTTTCTPISATYKVNITYNRSVQVVKHTVTDPRPFEIPNSRSESNYTWTDPPWPWKPASDGMQSYPPALLVWIRKQAEYIPLYSELALLDAYLPRIRTQWNYAIYFPAMNCTEPATLQNDTQVLLCEGPPNGFGAGPGTLSSYYNETSATGSLRGTVFDKSRNDHMKNQTDSDMLSAYLSPWDPRSKLELSEKRLNAVLSNITISALTLGTWLDLVPVTTTKYQSTYRFSHRANLLLPYAVCLVIAFLFGVVAVWSLWRNGVAATDGGFLQVMMATRGDTEMERLVFKEGVVATGEVSAELKRLRVRYGELTIGNEGAGASRVGFGTVGETVELKKRR